MISIPMRWSRALSRRKSPRPWTKSLSINEQARLFPRKMRLRRSSQLMAQDPYTLVIALDDVARAEGLLYMDDEHTLKHAQNGEFSVRQIAARGGSIHSQRVGGSEGLGIKNTIERIVFLNFQNRPATLTLSVESSDTPKLLDFTYDEKTKVLVVRKPDMLADEDWIIMARAG